MAADPVQTATAPRRRMSQAERSATMRRRVIEAAIICLRKVGYAATSTQAVMEIAGVSRGAMLHHFPAKVDLIIAVAEYAADAQDGHVRRRLEDVPPGVAQFLAVTEATWEAVNLPSSLALLEIMVASRSDPDLADRFAPVMSALKATQREGIWQMAQAIGVTRREAVEDMVALHHAAMRGLAIDLMSTGDRATADRAFALLVKYKAWLTGDLLTSSATSS